jgi:hypothetical protein
MMENADLEKTADVLDTSAYSDNGNVVKFEEYRKQVSFGDGDYIETCAIIRNRKGIIKYRTYSWEKLN